MALINPKTYTYHSFKNGAFQGLLNNVISDFSLSEEINSAGSTITITLAAPADNYGEGTIVDFNNEIDVYVIDDQVPNGLLIFKGYIVNYQPVFSDTNQEQVILTVMGFGATLNDYIIETGEVTDVNSPTQQTAFLLQSGNPKVGDLYPAIQSFTTGSGITKLSAISFTLAASTTVDIGDIVTVAVYANRTDAEGSTNLAAPIATASLPITSMTASVYKFTFAAVTTVASGTQYWVRIINISSAFSLGQQYGVNLYYDNTNPYPGGFLETVSFNGISWTAPVALGGDAYIITYSGTGNTVSPYLSQDPSIILKSIIDNYNAQGGKITYTSSSIDLTNTTVTYTFQTNTVFEGINKCLQMAPVGWYFYIDQTNNVLHFHKVPATATHSLSLGKNIKNLSIEKRAQDIVNVVYFVGGPIAGVNLYQKYVQQTSIDLYGRHAIRYSDNNVTLASTAQIIANSILSNQGQVELRIELDILDNGGDVNSIFGFNIESITLGESINFRSFGPGTGGSLWDQAKWDLAKWDFDITDLSSIIVQVTRVDYTPNVLHLSLSTVPPDITKRVQDIYRNVTQLNILNNPVVPS